MALKLCSLGSGSEGNSTLVYTDSTALLVDAGFSCRRTETLLNKVGFDPARLDALLITHEHGDHMRGADVFSRKYSLPVYLTEGTSAASSRFLNKKTAKEIIRPEETFNVGDMEIDPFSVPHDASEPVAFLISANGRRALVLTDIGSVTVRAVEKMRMANLALVESNHDTELLKIGPYPWPLKQRISGKYGHLSNDECAQLISSTGENGLCTVIFGHISKQNNNPDLVRITAENLFDGGRVKFAIASQDDPTQVFEV